MLLELTKTGLVSNRVKFQNVFEVYSLSQTIFFWYELSTNPIILLQGLFGLNRVKLGQNASKAISEKFGWMKGGTNKRTGQGYV